MFGNEIKQIFQVIEYKHDKNPNEDGVILSKPIVLKNEVAKSIAQSLGLSCYFTYDKLIDLVELKKQREREISEVIRLQKDIQSYIYHNIAPPSEILKKIQDIMKELMIGDVMNLRKGERYVKVYGMRNILTFEFSGNIIIYPKNLEDSSFSEFFRLIVSPLRRGITSR